MVTHSSVLAWIIPGTGKPGGLPSMGLHRVRHDWSDLAAAAAYSGKAMLKILQARLQYMNHELPHVQPGFRKGRGTRDQIGNIWWNIEIQGNSRKTSDSLISPNRVDHNKVENSLGDGHIRTTLPVFWETCMQFKKQQLEADEEQ